MKKIARELLKTQAVVIDRNNRFTWNSGIKAPIYVDNRVLTSHVESRTLVATALASLVKNTFPDVEMLFGVATAGIILASYVSHHLKLPIGYVRQASKKHGKQNRIEGVVKANMKVVVVEDLLSTGASALSAAKALAEAKMNVLGIAAIFSYNLTQLQANLKSYSDPALKVVSLTNLNDLLAVACEDKHISEIEAKHIKQFRDNL